MKRDHHRSTRRITCLAARLALFAALIAGAAARSDAEVTTTLPFTDGFEAYTNGTPLIDGTNGWYGDSSNIIVQTHTVRSGINAAMIPEDCTLSNRFVPSSATNVWIQMDARQSLYDGTNPPVVDASVAGMFYINTSGYFVVHNGPASPSASNSANWVTLTNFNAGTNGTNWVTIGIYEDFNMQRWHLYASNSLLGNTLVTNNIMFINQSLTNFSGLDIYNGATTSYLDNVSVIYSNKSALTVEGWFTVSNKPYDASPTAAISNNSLTLVGTNGTDDVTLMAVAVFTNKDAGMNKTVYLTGSWLAGSNAVNYTLSLTNAPTSTGDIYQVALNATLVAPITKVYDGNFEASLGAANYSLGGFIGSETCTVNQTMGAYDNKNVGTSKPVTATLASTNFDGTLGFLTNNYALPASAAGVGDINQATLTVALVPTITKTYDRSNTATLVSANYALGGLVLSETCTVTKTAGTYATTNVGTGILVSNTLASTDFDGALGFSTNNYALPTSAIGSVGVITAQAVTMGGSFQVSNKPCDGTTAATITNNNLTTNGVIVPDAVTLNAVAAFDDMNVGTNKIVRLTGSWLSGTDAGNYWLDTTSPTTTADITTNSQTITFAEIPAQPLANGSLTLSATASSGLPVTFSNAGPGTLVGNVITFSGGVGEYTIVASQTGDVNYTAAADVARTFPVYDSTAAPTTNTIPFDDTFEDYFNLTPLVNGTNGWYGSSVDIIVQKTVVSASGGLKAAMIPVDCTLSNRFQSKPPTNVWIQMDVRPSLYDGTNNPVADTNASWLFFVKSNGNFVVHNGPATNTAGNPDPTNSANWVETTNGGVETSGTNWVTIGIYQDFTQTNWDLYAKTNEDLSGAWILVTNNIGFVNTNLTNFAGFDIYNGSQTTYLDNVHVRAPGTVRVNPTNVVINVQWESQAAAPPQTNVLTADTGEWSFTNTISADATNWLSANPVTGTVNSDPGGTNLVMTDFATNLSVGSYPGTVTVNATNADGVPRTITIPVTLNVLGIWVDPTNLTWPNGYMYSNDLVIPEQTFMITNRGTLDVPYTIQTSGDATNWLSLSASGGTLAPAGSNASATNITVSYTTNAPGDYIGEVWVMTASGGGSTSRVSVAGQVVARPVIGLNTNILTQTVPMGAYLTNQPFTIRNGSIYPVVKMAFTSAPLNELPALIDSLSAVSGTSTGQPKSVTVNYKDISMLATGVYTAWVQVWAWDAGSSYTPTGTVHLSTNLEVQVTVWAPDAPWGVTASDGTYTNKVVVSWNPVAAAGNYKVYRYNTFNLTYAEPIGNSVGTNTSFDDLTGLAGWKYYYWVSSVNDSLCEGAKSTDRESGYRGLAAPGGLFATDGAYTNKVQVTWPTVDGAIGYRLYRGLEGGTLTSICYTVGGVYNDVAVMPGMHYVYQVGATNNGMLESARSVTNTGYSFGVPGGLSASDGTYAGKVHLTWIAVESASGYQVWRGAHAILPEAVKLTATAVVSTNYDDTNVLVGVKYYYWVRGESLLAGIGGFSAPAYGGCGAPVGLDLWVTNLVVLPIQVRTGSSPAIVSFRMGNGGGTNMADANGTVGMEFFATTNQVLTGNETNIGKVVGQVTLGIGQDMVMKVAGSQLVAPVTAGDYNIFVRVLPEFPSLLVDTNLGNNVTKRTGSVRVRSSGGLNYQAFNDYDGDGMSDLGVYRGMDWSIRSVDGRVWMNAVNICDGAGLPVLGDLDGDGYADPMVFNSKNGLWRILYSGQGYILTSEMFGGAGDTAMVADYEGVGHGDASVVNGRNGYWSVLKTVGGLTEWNWGAPGYIPVIGDYNGDGCWDMAVYQATTGIWYIRTLHGEELVWGMEFGGLGYRPVPGDYDGDGCWDMAVYERATGKWSIVSLDGLTLASGIQLGVPKSEPKPEPVMGDYDGDGKWDWAVYQEATGLWYIVSLDGRILAWASSWGGKGWRPIGN